MIERLFLESVEGKSLLQCSAYFNTHLEATPQGTTKTVVHAPRSVCADHHATHHQDWWLCGQSGLMLLIGRWLPPRWWGRTSPCRWIRTLRAQSGITSWQQTCCDFASLRVWRSSRLRRCTPAAVVRAICHVKNDVGKAHDNDIRAPDAMYWGMPTAWLDMKPLPHATQHQGRTKGIPVRSCKRLSIHSVGENGRE